MDSTSIFALTNMGWSIAQAVPLMFWPNLVTMLLSAAPNPPTVSSHGPPLAATPIEPVHYYARSLGISTLANSLVFFLLSGILPLGASPSTPDPLLIQPAVGSAVKTGVSSVDQDTNNPVPYRNAAVMVATFNSAAQAFYMWSHFSSPIAIAAGDASPQTTAATIGMAMHALMAAFGLWVLMFGQTSHISRRTGADKRTSGFPFGNKVSAQKDVPKPKKKHF